MEKNSRGAGLRGLTPTGVLDANGNRYWKSDGSSELSGLSNAVENQELTPLWRLDVRRDVQITKWGLLLLVSLFGVSFMYFIGEFKDVRKDTAALQGVQAGQAVVNQGTHDAMADMEKKLATLRGSSVEKKGGRQFH